MFDRLNTTKTHRRLVEELKIKWYHSTSRSPSHNGQVEAAVKIIKKTSIQQSKWKSFDSERILHAVGQRRINR